jgi:hypothetical protein
MALANFSPGVRQPWDMFENELINAVGVRLVRLQLLQSWNDC